MLRNEIRRRFHPDGLMTQLYIFGRLLLLPVEEVLQELEDTTGTILSIGCGYGLMELAIALRRPDLHIIGSDRETRRISIAKAAASDVSNVEFSVEDARHIMQKKTFNTILMVDLLHHIPRKDQKDLIMDCFSMVRPGGSIIIKDMDTKPTWKYLWNYAHDMAMTRFEEVAYRSREEWHGIFEDFCKADSRTIPTRYPYPHFILKAKKHAS